MRVQDKRNPFCCLSGSATEHQYLVSSLFLSRRRRGVSDPLRFFIAVLLSAVLAYPPQVRANVVDDSTKLLAQLNPVTGALDGLIGEAADKGNAVLQQQLEHLRSIIKEAIFDLDQVAKKRIDQLDQAAVKDIGILNDYVQQNLVQFDALVGKRLDQIDQTLYKRINQFNFGAANVLASIKWLNTIPLIQTDEAGNGITTFKQVGNETLLYIVGSGFTKHGNPSAYLSGGKIKADWTSAYGVLGDGVSVPVTGSMGLLEVRIPNKYLPDEPAPTHLSLELKFPSGVFESDKQYVPLHVCGKVPRLYASFAVQARGRHYLRRADPVRNLHAGCPNGNNNSADAVCLPPAAPDGYEFDGSTNYGNVLSFSGENHNGYGVVVWNQPGMGCLKAYCEGTEGNAHENIEGILMHLKKLEDVNPCTNTIVVPQDKDPQGLQRVELKYYGLTQISLSDAIARSKGGECSETVAIAPPVSSEKVELTDSLGKHLEYVTLIPGAPVSAKTVNVDFAMTLDGQLDVTATPKCEYHALPATE